MLRFGETQNRETKDKEGADKDKVIKEKITAELRVVPRLHVGPGRLKIIEWPGVLHSLGQQTRASYVHLALLDSAVALF